jgi:iron complex outermembrane receptor protein
MFGNKLVTKILVLVIVVLGIFISSYAADVDLERVVVTPYRYEESLGKTAADVSVVTEGDIEGSNAQNVVDVLRTLSGITVRDWYGNGTKVAVDMGGFGEQAALNVLVLVDGRRINDVDLSGVDWGQIPLDQIERVEVVRGGAGAVLYGDNASSGVINVITKKGSGKPKINLEAEYGSYSMNKEKLSLGGSVDNNFSYWLSGSYESTNGYRRNSFNKAKDFASKFSYDFTDMLSMHFDSGFHSASYGLPGALWDNNLEQNGRRSARYGNDHVNNRDYYFVVGAKNNFFDLGSLDIDFSYRQKDTDSYFFTSGNPTQKNKIETFGVTSKYSLNNNIFNYENKFVAGLDYYQTIYNSDTYTIPNNSLLTVTDINKTSLAGYVQDEFLFTKKFALVGGYRYEFSRYEFDYHDYNTTDWGHPYPDQDKTIQPSMQVFNSGLVYTYTDEGNVFFNLSKSFRFPEVDEFTYLDASWQQQLNTNLKPQSSIDSALGVRHRFSDLFSGSVTMFRMNVENELYYNSTGGPNMAGANENYDRTVHEGLEVNLNSKLNNWVNIFGNYTFTKAYFDGGVYDKNEIPLVSRHKGSVGFKFIFPQDFTLNINGTYVGKRYFLNDQANSQSRLNGYMVVDTNLSWKHNDLTIIFGINNLLDKQYSEYAGYGFNTTITPAANGKFYYPNPGRNFTMKAKYAF